MQGISNGSATPNDAIGKGESLKASSANISGGATSNGGGDGGSHGDDDNEDEQFV